MKPKYSDAEVKRYLAQVENSLGGVRLEFGFSDITVYATVSGTEEKLIIIERTDIAQTDDVLRSEYTGIVTYLVHNTETYGGDANKISQMRNRLKAIECYFDAKGEELFVGLRTGRSVLAHSAEVLDEPSGKWDPSLFLLQGMQREDQ